MNTPIVAFRLSAEDRALFQAVARTMRVNKTEALRRLVREYAAAHDVRPAPVDRQRGKRSVRKQITPK